MGLDKAEHVLGVENRTFRITYTLLCIDKRCAFVILSFLASTPGWKTGKTQCAFRDHSVHAETSFGLQFAFLKLVILALFRIHSVMHVHAYIDRRARNLLEQSVTSLDLRRQQACTDNEWASLESSLRRELFYVFDQCKMIFSDHDKLGSGFGQIGMWKGAETTGCSWKGL